MPYAGILFSIILVLVYIATFLFLPLYQGLVRAAFYEEITNPTEEPEPEPVPAEEDPTAAKLQSLKKLLDDGILTQEEFDAKKQQILGL
ncbi:MAG: SHOCT domain-containing protein [Oscillospiraceae bacterium]|nr:SHOCT domain-containing protein [Oscillospiraceae bacterium]